MERGTYKKHPIDFGALTVLKFPLTLFDPVASNSSVWGCGASCLALLTGEKPCDVAKENKFHVLNWPDKFMVRFLRRRGFTVVPLTKCDVSNTSKTANLIKENHILMISSMFIRGEASWYVLYNGLIFHNFEVVSLGNLELINRPLESAYIIFRPEWGSKFTSSKC